MTRALLGLSIVLIAALAGGPGSGRASAQPAPPHGACRPPAQSTATFLPGPPADAGYPVMAQVQLLDLVDARAPRGPSAAEAMASKVRVRVLTPIKGVGRNDVFVVDTGGGTCDEMVGLSRLGQQAFIAGKFLTGGVERTFVGQHAR